jgi:hypothetical protein
MKLILSAILSFLCFNSRVVSQEHRFVGQYGEQRILNLSASSNISYEDAMNKFNKIKPEGYAISSIKYLKSGNLFIVKVGLVKIS